MNIPVEDSLDQYLRRHESMQTTPEIVVKADEPKLGTLTVQSPKLTNPGLAESSSVLVEMSESKSAKNVGCEEMRMPAVDAVFNDNDQMSRIENLKLARNCNALVEIFRYWSKQNSPDNRCLIAHLHNLATFAELIYKKMAMESKDDEQRKRLKVAMGRIQKFRDALKSKDNVENLIPALPQVVGQSVLARFLMFQPAWNDVSDRYVKGHLFT